MLPYDQLKLIGCLMTAIPLSYMMSCLRKPALILALTCTVSIIMQILIFESWIVLLWAQQNVVFFLCKYGPRAKIGKIVLI